MAEKQTSEDKQDLDLEMLNAELTPDERLVAEEDAAALTEGRPSAFDTTDDEPSEATPPQFDPAVDPTSNGRAIPNDAIPDDLRRRAMDFGIDESTMTQLNQSGVLEPMLGRMDQMLLQKMSNQQAPGMLETNKVSPEPNKNIEVPEEEYELEFDKYMDPSIRSNFEKLSKQNQELKQKHQALIDFQQGQMMNDKLTQFDDMISRLGEDFHPMLGSSLEERSHAGSPANQAASELWATFEQLKRVSNGLTDEDVFRRAVSAVYPDHRVRIAESAVKRDVSDRLRDAKTGRFLSSARPSKRSEELMAPGGPDHEAQEFIDGFLAERGYRTQSASTLDEMLNG